ncbi:MAG: hypothetical protein J0I20_36030 [Chloroflexi bacterium]|nr:hypothetical protein [Chloroflexota bacterium]OJW06807.1 MAG: hypothetical protein BGO39_23720 [Chloroflexi bacterium 54-19]
MIKGIPVGIETIGVGLVVAVIGAVVSLFMSGQPITWPVIVSAVVAAGLNYFTSSARSGQGGFTPGTPSTPSDPKPPTSGASW